MSDLHKYLHITTQMGYVYRFPADLVAKDRAEHYADESPTAFEDEFKYTMETNFELTEWFSNNMNWEDVSAQAELISSPEKDEPVAGQDEVEVYEDIRG